MKSTVEEIRQRFDADVERFSNLATGQSATVAVFACVDRDDTPKPLLFQIEMLRAVGFSQVEILHKNICFAAFGAVRN